MAQPDTKNTDNLEEISTQINKTAEVPFDYCGRRLDQVASELFSEFSRSRLQQWIKEGLLKVDDAQWLPKRKVLGGERLDICASIEAEGEWVAEDIPLNIVFEDDHLLVINKTANFVVHPAAGNYSGTVLNALLHHCPSLCLIPRAGIVHRLDKDTTGLMVVAKTLEAHTNLVSQLQARSVKRVYHAVVNGLLTSGGLVDQPVGRHPRQRIKMAVISGGKEARTHYSVLERFKGHSHLQLKLETGRTHQIRVHMAHLGHPLVGDSLYAGRFKIHKGAPAKFIEYLRNFGRQALHAVELALVHPATGEEVSWSSPLPEDIQMLLSQLSDEQNDL
ncbi:MAG: 23S rRNA pseudouridine(1911/1915/1917) synthase RluD [Porticoccaceae bacterium]|nr:23S rRNA pseudouridine(1911/1915/1917) synthase RluD [Porticoccaceae bacterium]